MFPESGVLPVSAALSSFTVPAVSSVLSVTCLRVVSTMIALPAAELTVSAVLVVSAVLLYLLCILYCIFGPCGICRVFFCVE